MIYVASSWRNPRQPGVVQALRAAGNDVYDFRTHADFHWSDIDPAWESWSAEEVVEALKHPIAQRSFVCDMQALESCDALVLVMPCGRSAHLELGYAIGADKPTAVLLEVGEPEPMWAAADWIGADLGDLIAWLTVETAPAEPCNDVISQCTPERIEQIRSELVCHERLSDACDDCHLAAFEVSLHLEGQTPTDLVTDPETTAQRLITELGREGATELCAQLLVRLKPEDVLASGHAAPAEADYATLLGGIRSRHDADAAHAKIELALRERRRS